VENAGLVFVPTPALAECTTGDGARDAEVNRVLGVLSRAEGALVAPAENTARRAGALRFAAGSDDGIDALVAAEAWGDGKTPCVLLTSDADDMAVLLSEAAHVTVRCP
jgi:hypothetical protein